MKDKSKKRKYTTRAPVASYQWKLLAHFFRDGRIICIGRIKCLLLCKHMKKSSIMGVMEMVAHL